MSELRVRELWELPEDRDIASALCDALIEGGGKLVRLRRYREFKTGQIDGVWVEVEE